MTTYVLVHGAWHASWQWELVVPYLLETGAEVVAVDLPGRAGDARPLAEVSLPDYVDAVADVVASQSEPVVLVGHSLGGLTCSLVAERLPDRVQRLVYVAAMLFPAGKSVLDMIAEDPDALVGAAMDLHLDEGWSQILLDQADAVFYADCEPAAREQAKGRLLREPTGPLAVPLEITPENFGRVPRSYIACRHDRAITFDYQMKMVEESPCESVVVMQTSHSPFLAAPEELAHHLLSLR